ncbi:MAG: transposase, partial [Acidobacteriaceae bacterium]
AGQLRDNSVRARFGGRRGCAECERRRRDVTVLAHSRDIHVLAAGGTANHLHLLLLLPQSVTLAEAMRELKANSSRWLRETDRAFAWQEGYGAFSVSVSQKPRVMAYIAGQEEHHRKRSFEEEFTALLKTSGIAYDPRFVFG